MNESHDSHETSAEIAERDLAELRSKVNEAMALLTRLQHQVIEAEDELRRAQSAKLVEANEQLVLSMLRTVAEAEIAARDIAFRELTTQLRLERQRLGEENRLIVDAGRLKSQFLANMSHELRTPLNAIIGFADLLRQGIVTERSPKYLEYLHHIYTSGQHLLEVINSVLDLSKAASGKLQFHPGPVDLGEVVQEVVGMLGAAAGRKAVVMHTSIAPELGNLVLDRMRLKQVLINFVANAVKFSHQGGIVTVRAVAQPAERFCVEVEDRGIGIAAADQPRLFMQFEQLDSSHSRQHQGTGLGLALARLLVEAQGGSVGVRSTLGEGSVFYLVLKQNLVDLAAEQQADAPAASTVPMLGQD